MKSCCVYTFFYVLLLMLWAPSAHSQGFILKGAIKDKESNSRIGEAQVVNERTGLSVISSSLGLFQISVRIGDTLLVMKSGYSDFTAAVNTSKTDMIILMDRDHMLKEVNITAKSKKAELDDVKRDFKNKGSFYQGKPPAMSFLFKPLTALYELFGKTPKNARRFGRYYQSETEESLVDGFFNESLIKSNTPLEGRALETFMLYYRPSYERAKNWTAYDAIKYIKESYKTYEKSPIIDTDTLKKE